MNKTPTYTANAIKAREQRLKSEGLKFKRYLINSDTDTKLNARAKELGCSGERVLIEHFKE